MHRKQTLAMALAFVISMLTLFVMLHTRFLATPSLNHRFFWISGNRNAIEETRTGDYLTFTEYVPSPLDREITLVKRVGCVSGEHLRSDDNDNYYCNSSYLGHARQSTRTGQKLVPFRFNGIVPPGQLFLVGDHPDSYDSRYFGFVDRNRIQKRAWALL
jgi:conjugal transfer pilin signal peptidase TrbI